ncbi:unnamed protein product [Prunus brigantina]
MEQGDLVGSLNEVKERLWKALQSSEDGIIELTIGAEKVDKMLNLEKCFIVDSDFKIVLSGVRTRDNCCHVDAGSDSAFVFHKASDDTLTLRHQRLGHINFLELEKLSKRETVKGLPKLSSKVVGICGPCQLGKQVRSPHKKSEGIATSQPLELVHMDLVIISIHKAYRVFNKRTQTIME